MNRLSLQEDIRPLSEFRSHVASFVGQVRENHRPLLITHHGKSAAVLLDVAQYEDLLDQIELLQDIQVAERQIEANQGISHEQAKRKLAHHLRQ